MRKIPDDVLIQKLRDYIEKTGRLPRANEVHKIKDLPSVKAYKRAFGSWNKAIITAGYEPNYKRYTEKELIEILQKTYTESGNTPTTLTFRENPKLPSANVYEKRFGTWTNALERAGIPLNVITHELDDILTTYFGDIEGKVSYKTIIGYRSTLGDLRNFLSSKNKDWEHLNKDLIIEYIQHLKHSGSYSGFAVNTKPNTANTLIAKARHIASFLTWIEKYARRKEQKTIISIAEIENIKDTLKRPNVVGHKEETFRRALMQEEIDAIRNVIANPIERNIFDLGLNLGLRVSEYEQITLDMVLGTEDERRPRLNGSESIPRYEREHYIEVIGKGNKKRKVVVTDEMKHLIKKQLVLRKLNRVKHDRFFFSVGKKTKGRLQDYKVNKLYKKLSEDSGIYFRAHELRYTMAELFQELGVTQNIVKQRLGHIGDITQRYSRAKVLKRYKILQEKVDII